MRSLLVAGLIGLLASPALAAPYSPYPLADGFPNPSPSELQTIQMLAGGTLSNEAPPSALSAESAANLRLIAFNEIFEVAYFTDLLANITNNATGYTHFGIFDKAFVVESIKAVINVRVSHPSHIYSCADILLSVARTTPRPQRQRCPHRIQGGRHQALQIHLPGLHLRRGHHPRCDIH
jgi:hypothetical protein